MRMGLVAIANPGGFTWPGPWLARVAAAEPRFGVMYGVPSGVVWDPAGSGVVDSASLQAGFGVARGARLCEPCTVVQGYAKRPVLRELVHRGGLRADILSDGEIRIGDAVTALAAG